MFNRSVFVFGLFSTFYILFSIFYAVPTTLAGDEVCGGCAGSCYFQRSISEWSCVACGSTLGYCGGTDISGCEDDTDCIGHGSGTCIQTCNTAEGGDLCSGGVINKIVQCDTGPGSCEWTGTSKTCSYSGQICTESVSNLTYGCCGPGNCSGTNTPTPYVPPGGNTPTPIILTSTVSPTVGASGPPTCTLNLDDFNMSAGDTRRIIPGITQVNGTVDEVTFTSSDGSVVAICDAGTGPCTSGSANVVDSSPAFEVEATAVTAVPASASITVTGRMIDEGGIICTSDTANVVVGEELPWCQVVGGDTTSTNILINNIPSGERFILDGPGGYPGVPVYSASNLTALETSSTGWRVGTGVNISSRDNYSYDYFEGRLPAGVVVIPGGLVDLTSVGTAVGAAPNIYYVLIYEGGDLEITGNVNLGNRRVVVFVRNGNLNINGRINLNDGVGFFMAVVNGDINVDPSVGGDLIADLEGIYYAQGQFNTGTGGSGSDATLRTRGIVVGIGNSVTNGVVLRRNIVANATTPSETFVFAPDQLMLFPPFLGKRNVRWIEVAP